MCSNIMEYDYEASSYDVSRFSTKMGKHLDAVHKRIVANLLRSSGNLILDAGVGTGRFAIWLAEKGYDIIGIDISREMLKNVIRKSQYKHISNNYILSDMRKLPFRTEIFDSCISINVIDHIPDVSNFLKEAKYVIKTSGFLIFNFSNFQSPYLPFALVVNLRNRALFKTRILSSWSTFKEYCTLLSKINFKIEDLRGCMIASPIPLGNKLVKIVQLINSFFETSKYRHFSGSLFIKAQSNL